MLRRCAVALRQREIRVRLGAQFQGNGEAHSGALLLLLMGLVLCFLLDQPAARRTRSSVANVLSCDMTHRQVVGQSIKIHRVGESGPGARGAPLHLDAPCPKGEIRAAVPTKRSGDRARHIRRRRRRR